MVRRELAKPGTEYVELCADAVRTERHPGVVSAAWWAARQLDGEVEFAASESVYVDDISGMVFVQIPGTDEFRPGSPLDEEGRWSNEDPPKKGEPIGPLWISTTEVTVARLKPFLPRLRELSLDQSTGPVELEFLKDQLTVLERQQAEIKEADRKDPAAHFIAPYTANLFCEWLHDKAKKSKSAARHYLATETEWEYACRGGSSGSFCYGDSPEYVRYFAVQGGSEDAATRIVARRMPNFYGLFDMHGNLWEICNSPWRDNYSDPEPEDVDPLLDRLVQRGGALYSPALRCRSAQRNSIIDPKYVASYIGFRLLLELGEGT